MRWMRVWEIERMKINIDQRTLINNLIIVVN